MKKTLCQIAVCVLLSSLGEAAQVNYHGYGNAEGTGNIPVYFSVTQFDPSMGTLTGVSLSINESNIIHWNFNNVNAADTWTIALANGLVTVHQNGGVLTDLTAPAALDPTPYAVAADGLTIVTPEVGNFNFVPGYSAPAALAVFTGNGVVDYTVSFSGDWSVGGGYNPGEGDTYERDGTTRTMAWAVVYTYVPEPASLSLLALGVMAVGLRRRFRKTA